MCLNLNSIMWLETFTYTWEFEFVTYVNYSDGDINLREFRASLSLTLCPYLLCIMIYFLEIFICSEDIWMHQKWITEMRAMQVVTICQQ